MSDETIADPAPRRVFLIRHAEASEGEKDPDRGRHLTELGKLQADALARRAARWQLDAIFCSDRYGSCETAAAISFHHPDAVCTVDPLFREVPAGMVRRELDAPSGVLRARLEAAWERVVTMPYPLTVIITHVGLIKYCISRSVRWDELKPPFRSAHTGITALALRTKGRAALQFFNDTRHLTPELVSEERGEKRPWLEDPVTGRWRFGLSSWFACCVDAGEPRAAAVGEPLLHLLAGAGL